MEKVCRVEKEGRDAGRDGNWVFMVGNGMRGDWGNYGKV